MHCASCGVGEPFRFKSWSQGAPPYPALLSLSGRQFCKPQSLALSLSLFSPLFRVPSRCGTRIAP
jgi:hypothetical protein